VFLALSKLLDLAFEPLAWALALLALAALLRRRGRAPWALAAASFAVLVVFSLPRVANAIQRRAEAGAHRTYRPDVVYDAVVVLGGIVEVDAAQRSGELELRDEADRIVRAYELWRAGRVRTILLSGGLLEPVPGLAPEADALRDALVRWGVPPEAILVEDRSRNTRENAIETARLVAARHLGSLLLVTSAAHVPRALGCFHAVGLAPDVLPVDHRAADGGGWEPRASALAQSTAALRELAGRVVYRVAGYTR
jgi:uncharacterized SAM-binding protein YcdF (DUF218 family)